MPIQLNDPRIIRVEAMLSTKSTQWPLNAADKAAIQALLDDWKELQAGPSEVARIVPANSGNQKPDRPIVVAQALDQCDRILAAADGMPEEAIEFADSVNERVAEMRVWIEEKNYVTAKMLAALGNIEDGIGKWRS